MFLFSFVFVQMAQTDAIRLFCLLVRLDADARQSGGCAFKKVGPNVNADPQESTKIFRLAREWREMVQRWIGSGRCFACVMALKATQKIFAGGGSSRRRRRTYANALSTTRSTLAREIFPDLKFRRDRAFA